MPSRSAISRWDRSSSSRSSTTARRRAGSCSRARSTRAAKRRGLRRQARVVVGIGRSDVFDHRQRLIAVTAASAQERRGAVRGDAVEPRGEAGVAAEASQVPERTDVGVLHDVGGVGLVTGELHGEAVDVAIGEPDELVECTVVAVAGSVDERGEFGCSGHERSLLLRSERWRNLGPATAKPTRRGRRPHQDRSRSIFCMTTTSSHLPNFRPISRSWPTWSKPAERWSAIDATLSAVIRPIMVWNP